MMKNILSKLNQIIKEENADPYLKDQLKKKREIIANDKKVKK